MKTSTLKAILFISLLVPLMFGCKNLDSSSKEETGTEDVLDQTNVNLNLDFSSLLSTTASKSGGNESAPLMPSAFSERIASFDAGSASFLDATVTFEAIPSGITASYPLTVGLDASWDTKVEHTMALQGGNYKVSLEASSDGQRYFGTSSSVTIDADSTNDVAIEIHPVIGNSSISADVTTQLPKYYFEYPAGDFDGTPDSYTMTVSVDGAGDSDFTFDEFTDVTTTRLYMDISDGPHDLLIEVKKSGTVVARYNAVTDFNMGSDLTNLDLVPVFGTTSFTVSEVGGDARFDIKLLGSAYDLVHTETSGNFEYRIAGSGTYNDISEDVITFVYDGSSDYNATVTYSDFQFDTMALDIRIYEIHDTRPAEQVGKCSFTVALHKDGISESCDLTINRRAQASGRVVQVLGVNVVDATGAAVPAGTRVYVNGSLAGVTGGVDVANGYITLFLEPDTNHDIFATTAAGDATSDITSYAAESGKIDNILIRLN
jgi:hypothetical protein